MFSGVILDLFEGLLFIDIVEFLTPYTPYEASITLNLVYQFRLHLQKRFIGPHNGPIHVTIASLHYTSFLSSPLNGLAVCGVLQLSLSSGMRAHILLTCHGFDD